MRAERQYEGFEENLKELQVLELKWGKMRADLARRLLKEQTRLFNFCFTIFGGIFLFISIISRGCPDY